MQGTGARESELREGARGGLDEGQAVAGDERGCGMVGGLIFAANFDGNAAKGAGDLPGYAKGCAVAFDGEDNAIEAGHSATAECLHGMERTCRSAAAGERGQDGAVERATGVKEYFGADVICAEASERIRDCFERAIRGGQENYISIERVASEACVRGAGTDQADCGP